MELDGELEQWRRGGADDAGAVDLAIDRSRTVEIARD
jgi:hypothetical protein